MFGQVFYYESIKKIVKVFGNLFREIAVARRDASGNIQKMLLVPIAYSDKSKWLTRILQDKTLNSEAGLILPRMAFEITGMTYDPTRHLATIGRNTWQSSDNTKRKHIFNPVPYNFDISMSIACENADDAAQILEGIAVFFAPEFTVNVKTLPDMGITQDIPIVLNSITRDYDSTGSFEDRRLIVWDLSFTLKSFFYGAIKEQSLIREVHVDTHVVPGSGPVTDAEIEETPIHIVQIVVPSPLDVNPLTEDYGFSETLQEFYDGVRYNNTTGEYENI